MFQPKDVDYLVDVINNYGRRVAYEELKSVYGLSILEHDVEIFNVWKNFLEIMENDGRI